MIHGIAIFGLNGGGKSTLTHALAKQIYCFEMDVEDYYFPEQRKSRIWALENKSIIDIEHIEKPPYSNPRTMREEKRFGARVLDGADMFSQQMEFRKVVENRDLKAVEESAMKLVCPVIVIDGTLPVIQNLEKIRDYLII